MVFDDIYRHQVWNVTDGGRVMVLLDEQRSPNRRGRLLNRVVLKLIQLSSFIQDAGKRHRTWEQGQSKKRDHKAPIKACKRPQPSDRAVLWG